MFCIVDDDTVKSTDMCSSMLVETVAVAGRRM